MNVRKGITLLLALTTVSFMALIAYHAVHRHVIPVSNQGGLELFKKWSEEPFESITQDSNIWHSLSSRISAQLKNSGFSQEQKDKLIASVQGMVKAFSSGKYIDYEDFRFPVKNGQFNSKHISLMYKSLAMDDPYFKTYSNSLSRTDPDFAWKVLRHFWICTGIQTNVFCVKCWKDISIRSTKVYSFSEAHSVPALKTIIGAHNNVGINWWRPIFTFRPSPNQVIQMANGVDLAVISITVRTTITKTVTKLTDATPVYCLFYWCPEDKVWLPDQFGGAYSGKQKALYIF